MNRPIVAHAVDAAVLPAFSVAWFADPSHIMASIMFVVGMAWYGVQFYDRFFKAKGAKDETPSH